MPQIYRYFGFIFFFYSNEHTPIHVHVVHGDRQNIFELIMQDGHLQEIRCRQTTKAEPLSSKEQKTAESFIQKYHKNIIEKWIKFFVKKQSVRSTNIKTRL